PGLAQLPELRVEPAVRRLVEGEAVDAVLQDVGGGGEGRPPVARGAGVGARLGHGIATRPEDQVVHDPHDGRVVLGAGDLAQAGHQAGVRSEAEAGAWATSSGPKGRVAAAISRRMPSGSWK